MGKCGFGRVRDIEIILNVHFVNHWTAEDFKKNMINIMQGEGYVR